MPLGTGKFCSIFLVPEDARIMLTPFSTNDSLITLILIHEETSKHHDSIGLKSRLFNLYKLGNLYNYHSISLGEFSLFGGVGEGFA